MRRRFVLPAVLSALLLSSCDRGPIEHRFGGSTMGTRYLVHAFCEAPVDALEARVARLLQDVNDQMSTWQQDSTLSAVNAAPVGEWTPVTPEMAEVVAAALTLSEKSDGAFDVTVGPLVNLWGFGPAGGRDTAPSQREIDAALARTGFRHIELRTSPPALRKIRETYVDLSAIAKGHAVDRVIESLAAWQCASALVEIGGDLRAGAAKPDGSPWRIGIEVPDTDRHGGVHTVIEVTDRSVATSGDYRNFADWDGERASHIIDPRTGHPARSELRSVTVLHPSNLWADGYATLIDVLGPEQGHAFALEHELPVLFIVETEAGLKTYTTPAFDAVAETDNYAR